MKPSGCVELTGPFGSFHKLRLLFVLSGRTEELESKELSRDMFPVIFSAGILRDVSLYIEWRLGTSCSSMLGMESESSQVMLEGTNKFSGALRRKKSMSDGFGSLMKDQLMGDERRLLEGEGFNETQLSRDSCSGSFGLARCWVMGELVLAEV